MSLNPYRINRDVDGALASQQFDLAIIGGGITGISLAREAAGRGLRTVLLEAADFGSGTSAATTKYIHGGIRYLEQYDVGVVRESLRERRILALGAPHLVEQTRFIMPAWRWSKPPTALIGAGVLLYDFLAFDRNRHAPSSLRIPHPRWMSRRKLLAAVPWLDAAGLQGAFAYHDTLNVHPERLLLAYAKSAVAAGAVLLNHVQVDGFIFEEPDTGMNRDRSRLTVSGVRVTDRLSHRTGEIRATVVVNAAGPWIDRVLGILERSTGVGVERSKGVHVLTRPLGGVGRVNDAVFARARSGRHVIVSPWQGRSFIGPTDTPIDGNDSSVAVDPDDVALILDTVNSTMSDVETPLTVDDVELTTVGVRPLIRTDRPVDETDSHTPKSTYSASRAHEFYHHSERGIDNLWTIGGGKWTTARATAEQMVDKLLRHELHGASARSTSTRRAAVAGSFAWAEDAEPYLLDVVNGLSRRSIPGPVAEHVARLYGTEWRLLADLVETDSALAERISSSSKDIAAQVVFAVTHESAYTLSDIVDRRLVLGTVGGVTIADLRRVAAIAGPLWGWDGQQIDQEVQREFNRRSVIEAHWKTPVPNRILSRAPAG